MKTVIMAGGEGTRLRPLTCCRPKPMVPIANKPVMEHIIELLKKYGLNEIAVTLQYMPEQIKEYFTDGEEFGVRLRYYEEKTPLGTAGSVKNAEEFLDDTFLVISGDALTDIDLEEAIRFHNEKNSIATLVLKKVDIPLEYGVVVTESDGRIIRFLEKPSWGEVFSDTVNTGIYILSPEVLSFFERNEKFDFSKDLFPIILKKGLPMYGYITEGYWCDIGDIDAYKQAHIDIMEGKVKLNIPGKEIRKGVWIDEGTEIEEGVRIDSPCIIGKYNKIKKNTIIGEYSVLGHFNLVEEGASIKRSIINCNCLIDHNVELRGSIISSKVQMREGSSAFEASVIGDESVIKDNAIIKPNIKIWPEKVVDPGIEVNSNLIWGTRFIRNIFGNRGISGRINIDIVPEYASKLGAAYGSIHKGNARIGLSCDTSSTALMLKISFIAGLMSAGAEVYDLGKMLLPVTRSAIRFYKLDGGIHISTSTEDPARVFIDFLDKKGCNYDRRTERKIENAFMREDFNRCDGTCIQEFKTTPDYNEFYLLNIINSIRSKKLNFKIALNTRSEFISDVMTRLLMEVGCQVELTGSQLKDIKRRAHRNGLTDVRFFTNYVKLRGFDLGVSVEDTCEKMMLVDNKGRLVTDDMFIALISIILFKTINGGTVVAPISATGILEKLADENKGKVIRTKTSIQDIMAEMLSNELKEGMLDQFTMHFDAMAGLIKILDFMALNNYQLSELVNMIPEFFINKKEVECPWNYKGKVIRQIITDGGKDTVETVEGVKIYQDGGWVLVLPDNEKAVCKVISESYSAEFAEELCNIYVNKIREISKG